MAVAAARSHVKRDVDQVIAILHLYVDDLFLRCLNQGILDQTMDDFKKLFTSQRVKHFAIKLAWLRQQEESGLVVYCKVHTNDNKADQLTKILPRDTLERHRDRILSRV